MTELGKIYIIRNTINSKVYIGQTRVSLKLRFQNHLSAARRGKDYIIGKAIRKYGEEKFFIELIEELPIEELNSREIYWIDYYKSTKNKFGYNISIGGNVVRITKELDKYKVLTLFNSGVSAYKIAKLLHVAISKITPILKEYNLVYGLDKQRTDSNLEKLIVQWYTKGYSTIDISKKTLLNKSTVRRILIRNNIKLRTFKETKNLGRNLPTLV